MAKKIVVTRGTVTVLKKTGKGESAKTEKVTLGPGDPVGSLISKKEKDAMIEDGTLGYAEDLAGAVVDTGDLAAELARETQRADDATKAAAEAIEAKKTAESLAAKADEARKSAEESYQKATAEIEQLKKDLAAAEAKSKTAASK